MNIKLIIGLLVFILILIISALFVLRSPSNESRTGIPFLLPTSVPHVTYPPEQSPYYIQTTKQIDIQNQTLRSKEQAVARILTKFPYKGTNFTVDINYDTAQYVVTIPKDKQKEGNDEFDAFLKQNGVQDRSWIRSNNLLIQYQ